MPALFGDKIGHGVIRNVIMDGIQKNGAMLGDIDGSEYGGGGITAAYFPSVGEVNQKGDEK